MLPKTRSPFFFSFFFDGVDSSKGAAESASQLPRYDTNQDVMESLQ